MGERAYLATQIKALKATNPNTVIVSAGDCIGASPLVSALFHDEPTIEALSEIGLDYSAAGNHEFDKGVAELLRMQYGCCHQVDGCQDKDRFVGAGYYYLTANVVNNSTNSTLFPPYKIREIEGIPVAFIGVSLEDTPTVVTPSGVRGLTFLDEADSINAVVAELKEKGIKTIIVLIHDGGKQDGLPSESRNFSGSIIDIVKRSDKEVDVFVTGHTHQSYVSNVDGRIVTQADWQGKFLTDIDLVISKETGDVLLARAKNVAVTRDVPEDADVSEIVEKYSALAEPLTQKVIGSITADIPKKPSNSGESALGDVIADTQLYSAKKEGAVVAFMNIGGIRTDLIYKASENEGAGNVTYGEAFSVQPFGNSIYTLNLTGSQIDELLEEQFDNPEVGRNSILQVSRGFQLHLEPKCSHRSEGRYQLHQDQWNDHRSRGKLSHRSQSIPGGWRRSTSASLKPEWTGSAGLAIWMPLWNTSRRSRRYHPDRWTGLRLLVSRSIGNHIKWKSWFKDSRIFSICKSARFFRIRAALSLRMSSIAFTFHAANCLISSNCS